MDQPESGNIQPSVFADIQQILQKSLEFEEKNVQLSLEELELTKKRTTDMSSLTPLLSSTALNTEKQTGMAQERTALTREQTRLSTRSTELANIRTDLGRERTFMAEQRTELSVQRTELARRRTSLAEARTKLAQTRTDLAGNRTMRALTRSRLSMQRTELARGRTYLAIIRTGLAFLTLGLALFRYFGVSAWSLFDGGLAVISLGMIFMGTRGFRKTRQVDRRIADLLSRDSTYLDLVTSDSRP